MIQKIAFYFLSLTFLFITVGLLSMDIPFVIGGDFIGFERLWNSTKLGLSIIVFSCVIEWLVFRFVKKSWGKNSEELSVQIIEPPKNENYNTLNFIASFFIPLVSFNYLKLNHWIALVFLLVIVGIIFCKSNGFYNNPTLAILGFQLYNVKVITQKEGNDKNETIMLISQKRLSKGNTIKYVMLSEGVGVVTYRK